MSDDSVCVRVCVARRGWLSVSVTSAALHLVLIASELITPASVKQCCQTSPAQPSTPAGQMEEAGCCIRRASEELKSCSRRLLQAAIVTAAVFG